MINVKSALRHPNGTHAEIIESLPHPHLANDFQSPNDPFEHLLYKRDDVCTNAFGSGWMSSTCAPGRTLCCVNVKQSYPQCQQHLGLGWCCTEADKGCYVDLQSSSCGQPGAVQCSQLGPGVDEACCPQYTTCAPGYNATTTHVRCNIQELALQALTPSAIPSLGEATKTKDLSETPESAQSSQTSDQSTSKSAQSSSTTSSTYTSSSATQSTQTTVRTPAETPAPSSTTHLDANSAAETESTQPSSGIILNSGTMAGIVVGGVAAIVLLLLALWLLWRKKRRTRSQAAASKDHHVYEKENSGELQNQYSDPKSHTMYTKHEMEDTRRQELWGGSFSPKEMQAGEVAELDGSAR